MSRTRTFGALAVIAALAVALAVYTEREVDPIARGGEHLFPGLFDRLNEVRSIVATSGGESFLVELVDGRWSVVEKSGYPADVDTVHQLLVGAASLERIEPKTANPELHARLGVENPSTAGSKSVRYVVADASGAALADLVVGNRKPSKTTLEDSEIYVRLGVDPQSWLVHGRLPSGSTAGDWVDRTIIAVPEARIHDVEIVHPDGERIVLRKAQPADVDYLLVDLPEGREIDGQYKLNDIGRTFSQFELEDVRKGTLDDVGGEPGLRAVMGTFDGLEVTLETRVDGERTFGAFQAAVNPTRFPAVDAARAAASDERARDAVQALLAPDAVEAEAERFASGWDGWVFELPSFRANYFSKRRDDLLEPLPEPATPPEPGISLEPPPVAVPPPGPAPDVESAPDSNS